MDTRKAGGGDLQASGVRVSGYVANATLKERRRKMRKGLYPIIAGGLLLPLLISSLFKTQINNSSGFIQIIIIILVVSIGVGAILLTLWDTGIIGQKKP